MDKDTRKAYDWMRYRLGNETYKMLRRNGLTRQECYDIANDRDPKGNLNPRQDFTQSAWQEVFKTRRNRINKLQRRNEQKGVGQLGRYKLDSLIDQWEIKGETADIWRWFRDAYDRMKKKADQLNKKSYMD